MRAIWPGALLVVYLSATGVLLLVDWRRTSAAALATHLALLAAVATTTWSERVPDWLRDWAPFVVLLALYSEMPQLIRAGGALGLYDPTVIDWEGLLFPGQPSLDWARRAPFRALSEPLHLAYLSYYPIIFGVPAALYLTDRREDFSAAAFAVMLSFVVCFASYIVFPVAGPRYVWPTASVAPDGPVRAFTLWLLEARSSKGTAFPSSHVAVSVAQSILAVRYFGVKGLGIALLTVGVAAGAVYGGFHYAIDVLAGAVVGALTCGLGLVAAKRLRTYANASAPT